MASLNKVIIAGNLTRDPQAKYTPSGTAVAELGVAVNRQWFDKATNQKREEVTFVDVSVWGKQAEICAQYLTKGAGVFVEGRLSLDSWEDKATGQKRTKLKVTAESVQFLGRGGNDSVDNSASGEDANSVASGAGQRSQDEEPPF